MAESACRSNCSGWHQLRGEPPKCLASSRFSSPHWRSAIVAAGPSAAPTAAGGNAPIVITEPIDEFDVVEEPDGTVITFRQTGTRTTFTFPNGRSTLREEYTMRQVMVDAAGALISDITAVLVKARRPRRAHGAAPPRSEAEATLADGSVCASSSVFMVANDKVVKQESAGPTCS